MKLKSLSQKEKEIQGVCIYCSQPEGRHLVKCRQVTLEDALRRIKDLEYLQLCNARAILKLTSDRVLWQGKFAMVKHENNKLRRQLYKQTNKQTNKQKAGE